MNDINLQYHDSQSGAMPTYELLDRHDLPRKTWKRARFWGFLGLLNVAANRWMDGLPIRVFNLKN